MQIKCLLPKAWSLLVLFLLPGLVHTAGAQMAVTDSLSALQLVRKFTGPGVIVLNPVLSCPGMASGSFSIYGAHNLGIDSGIVLTTGRVETRSNTIWGVNGGNATNFAGPSNTSLGDTFDVDLKRLVDTFRLRDVCKLEFDFMATGNSLSLEYAFASTEYRNFSCSRYNDVFGFFITGPGFPTPTNIAVIPGTAIPVSVNSTTDVSINTPTLLAACTNMGPGSPFSQYYVDNRGGATVSYAGFTKPFKAAAALLPCNLYHLKMVIADCSDPNLDSGVFIKAGSFSSDTVASSLTWDTSFCYNSEFPPVVLRARAGYAAQRWNDGDTNRVRTVYGSGTYWVKYDFCQLLVDTFKVNGVEAPPVFSLGPDTTICSRNKRLVLAAPEGPYSYQWHDTVSARMHPVLQGGTYAVRVTAGNGCSAADTIRVSTRDCRCFGIIANAFTPNSDGLNDRFMPRVSPDCRPARNFAFRVYDRWGQQVFSAFAPDDKGWDGTVRGRPADGGTYFYEVKFSGPEEDMEVFEKGDITLVR